PLAVVVLVAQLAVPVDGRGRRRDAGAVVHVAALVELLGPRVVEGRRPRVELLVVALLEVGLVAEQVGAAVPVGRDDELVALTVRAHGPSFVVRRLPSR